MNNLSRRQQNRINKQNRALDAALKNILGGKVKDSSGINVKW